MCHYVATYNRSSTVSISKTCPSDLDSNGSTNRTYETKLEPHVQKRMLAALDQLQAHPPSSYYGSIMPFHFAFSDFDFRFISQDGNVLSVRVEGGSEETLPTDLLQIQRFVADGNLRMMQNANDALADLINIDDGTAASTTVAVVFSQNDGGLAQACSCDGDGHLYGTSARSKTISSTGAVELWSGCERRTSFVDDGNQFTRCKTYEVNNTHLAPAQWATLKKLILSASPLSFAENYPCHSYLDCSPDISGSTLIIGVGQARRQTSWPTGEERQLPARLQYILSILPWR